MPKISVIIPVYNVERYLARCIDSVLSQTFSDFECILVNDGSSNNSSLICDEYAGKDVRVKIIHKEHGGASSARNSGLDAAQGEYICFVDGDDWCDLELLELLLQNAQKHEADVSICGFRRIDDKGETFHIPLKKYRNALMNGKSAILRSFREGYYGGSVCCKLFKKSLRFPTKLAGRGNATLYFDETIQYAEDRLFFHLLLKRAKKVYYTPGVYYNYFIRSDSLTSRCGEQPLSTASMTRFDAFGKMLHFETDNKIKRAIHCLVGRHAIVLSLWCLNNGEFNNAKFSFFNKMIKAKLGYIVFFDTFREKVRYGRLIPRILLDRRNSG